MKLFTPNKNYIKCIECNLWAHEKCASADIQHYYFCPNRTVDECEGEDDDDADFYAKINFPSL